jgi:hypothetical protein
MSMPFGDGEPAGLGRLGVELGGGLARDDIGRGRWSELVLSPSTLARFELEKHNRIR